MTVDISSTNYLPHPVKVVKERTLIISHMEYKIEKFDLGNQKFMTPFSFQNLYFTYCVVYSGRKEIPPSNLKTLSVSRIWILNVDEKRNT